MVLEQIFDRVLVESGQFILPNGSVELKVDKFKMLVERALGVLDKYTPIVKRFNVNIPNRSYEFTATSTEYPGIPDKIYKALPTRINGVPTFFFKQNFGLTNPFDKPTFNFTYQYPVLYVEVGAYFDITAGYNHKLREEDLGNNVILYHLDSVDESHDLFFSILTGKFMQAVGRARNAFTLNPLDITDSASDVISEGKEMEKEATERLVEEEHKFFLAWR